ncbi:hypothetical protein AMS68_004563 [Peltaster fructicola]|uniref:Transcription initiation factor TFIID subunit 10 n=1 Tax=Peltaster fructicola TaxID=286661 RepID=A0A6H0XWI8_9PEZI|nr:hypothetical protein AMS68_004563 [Peltaster fructicola]
MADGNASPSLPSASTLPQSQDLQSQQLDSTMSSTQADTQQAPSRDTNMSDAPTTAARDISDADLDASIAVETNPSAPISSVGFDGAAEQAPTSSGEPLPTVIPPEPSIPAKKDTTLRSFLAKSDQYTPLIPDAVTDYYLTLAGLPPPPETDRRLARLLALATQKFIADIAADAYQYSRIRSTNTTSNNPLTGLGGAAGFMGGIAPAAGGDGEGTGKKGKDAGKAAPIGGPRAGFGGGGAGGQQGRTVLTMEDLGMAVGEYGLNVKRGEYYR